MHGEILLYDMPDQLLNNFEYLASPVGYGLAILVNDKYSLEEQLNNKDELTKTLKQFINEYEDDNFYDDFETVRKQSIKELNYLIKNKDKLLNVCDFVRLNFDKLDKYEYIKNNHLLDNKNIVISEDISLMDEDKLNKLLDKYKDIKDRIYVFLEGNLNYASLEESKKTIESIKNVASGVKALNLSPMETIMYVYDLVRNRVYTKEGKNDSKDISRDLSKALLGDKIVCLGYSNIFSAILNYLGIKCNNVRLMTNNKKSGHARNIIYVQDKKYDIDGVYYFDATWDSKKSEYDNSYLNSYKFFAKTKSYMNKYDEFNNFYDESFTFFENLDELLDKLLNGISLVENVKYVRSINYMSRIIHNKDLIDFGAMARDGFLQIKIDEEDLYDLYDKFNKEIPGDTMLQILNNIRKIQSVQDSKWYNYSLNDMADVYFNSDWKLRRIRAVELLYKTVFGNDNYKASERETIYALRDFFKSNNIAREIEGTKLTRILKQELNRKENK